MSRRVDKAPALRDGLMRVFKVTNIAQPGEMPKQGLRFFCRLAYLERTVGMSRYWTAQQASADISLLLRTHRRRDVTTHHVVILRDGEQYNIRQIQYPSEVRPPVMDLSLERRADKYDVEEVGS